MSFRSYSKPSRTFPAAITVISNWDHGDSLLNPLILNGRRTSVTDANGNRAEMRARSSRSATMEAPACSSTATTPGASPMPRTRAGSSTQARFWLAELGMYHYKGRMYSPTLGRFPQTDPVGYEGGINLYAYVENDPLNHADPDGRTALPNGLGGMLWNALPDHVKEDIATGVEVLGVAWDVATLPTGVGSGPEGIAASQGISRAIRAEVRDAGEMARGAAGGQRAGRSFTQRGRETIDRRNVERHGRPTCENCRREVVPGQRHERGVTPPRNERQRDHIIPRSRGGDGTPENGQTLCRNCNLRKRDRAPE